MERLITVLNKIILQIQVNNHSNQYKQNVHPKEFVCLMIIHSSSLNSFVTPVIPFLFRYVESMKKLKYWNFIMAFSVTYLVTQELEKLTVLMLTIKKNIESIKVEKNLLK